ncbi:hypothetical protein LCGC14_1068940 [marine sediment metagenome]|uniref:Uncharacterized protein n=1 Tax=marine sediment metagenome TaxID=412755 RepID=A0A0F9MNP2_9ZZZZ
MWMVGRSFWILEESGDWSWTWDFHGVFSDRGKAEALCKDIFWFIVPVVVDQQLPEDPYEFPSFFAPNKTEAEPLQHRRPVKEA